MYKKCVCRLLKSEKRNTFLPPIAIITLAILKIFFPFYYIYGIYFTLGSAALLALYSVVLAVTGLCADKSDESSWITSSDREETHKAYLIHCQRAFYTLNMIKTSTFVIIISAIGLFLNKNFALGTTKDIAIGIISIIILIVASLSASFLADFMGFYAYKRPWEQYKQYYNPFEV